MRKFTSSLANGKNKREPLNDLSRVFLRLESLRLAAFLPVSPICRSQNGRKKYLIHGVLLVLERVILKTIVLTKMTAKALLGAVLSQFQLEFQ